MTVLISLDKFQLAHNNKPILKDITLNIQTGERIAFVGASGAGKSSLLSELYRLLGDDAALCPQQLGLVDALSAYHNIYMAQLEHHGFWVNFWNLIFPIPRFRREISALAKGFGLSELLFRSTAKLSGGERQRVALARATYREKPVFIGDEPVSSLDPEQGQRLLKRICESHQTVMVALHNPKLALKNFHRVIGLADGEIKFDSAAGELTEDFLVQFYRGE